MRVTNCNGKKVKHRFHVLLPGCIFTPSQVSFPTPWKECITEKELSEIQRTVQEEEETAERQR